MGIYCVSYDLKKERDYEDLYKKLKAYDYIHTLESTWFVNSEKGAPEIKDDLGESIDYDDSLIVIEVKKHWGFLRAGDTADWLRERM